MYRQTSMDNSTSSGSAAAAVPFVHFPHFFSVLCPISSQLPLPSHIKNPPSDDSVLDDILSPMERNIKTYLVSSVSKDLLELLAIMAVERPNDPHLWLGSKLVERSPNGPFIVSKRNSYARVKPGELARAEGEGWVIGDAREE